MTIVFLTETPVHLHGACIMQISEYFEKAKGRGVMATADSTGHLTAAVYAKPHFFGENSIAFIMADRLTHQNLQSNPHAVYLFMESGEGYAGKRCTIGELSKFQNLL